MMKQHKVFVYGLMLLMAPGLLIGCSGDSDNGGITQSVSDLNVLSASSKGGDKPRQPPQEAFDACDDKSEGDTAALTTPEGETVTGTCQMVQDQLVLVPEGGREGQGPPPEAVEACVGKSEGAAVELTTPDGETVAGTCQIIQDQLALLPERGRPGGPPSIRE